jgi:Domain of unknown function (DUF1902)
MAEKLIVVKAARDTDAGVWYIESSDLPGLRLEAKTLELLAKKLPGAILDLLEAGQADGQYDASQDTPVEIIAHMSTRVQRADA